MSAPWHAGTINPGALEALYDDPAGLDDVVLVGVELQSRAGRVQLRFELPRFPDHPPPRWERAANTVLVTLDCFLSHGDGAATEVRLDGAATEHPARLAVEPEGDELVVVVRGPTVAFRARCAVLRIAGFAAYVNDPGAGE